MRESVWGRDRVCARERVCECERERVRGCVREKRRRRKRRKKKDFSKKRIKIRDTTSTPFISAWNGTFSPMQP